MPCRHPDIRKFDGVRCCLACGEAVFEKPEIARTSEANREDKSSLYQYDPLNFALGQEIRLVVVLPGERWDPIVCEVIHVNLEDHPEYEAVSYTWATEEGDASLSETISCRNGGIIKITANCKAVLQALRSTGLRKRLWIDSISIDQSNVKERNHQVGQMDLIFSSASNVLVGIHDPKRSYAQLFRRIKEGDVETNQVDTSAEWQVKKLLSLRYFGRVWTIQEVVLARSAFLVVNDDRLLLSRQVMERLRSFCTGNASPLPAILRWVPGDNPQSDIVACLAATLESKSTDPRDRVYAILSLLQPLPRSVIPVDYTLEVESVYANAVAAIIASHRNLTILSYIEFSEDADWRTKPAISFADFKRFLTESIVNKRRYYNSIASRPWHSSISVKIVKELEEDSSRAEDSIAHTAMIELANGVRRDILPRMRVRAHFIDKLRFLAHSTASVFAEHVLGDASYLLSPTYSWVLKYFRRTNQRDRNTQNAWTSVKQNSLDLLAPELVPDFNVEDLMDFLDDIEVWESNDILDRRRSAIMIETCHSVGCVSRRYESSSPPDGDEVWAIDGARAPFILRSMGSNRYRIVTHCYLWAAMDLDYWKPGSKKGLWGAGVTQHQREQTSVIEIC